jgi:hypothetical protein
VLCPPEAARAIWRFIQNCSQQTQGLCTALSTGAYRAVSKVCPAVSTVFRKLRAARRQLLLPVLLSARDSFFMRNGLYSIHINMLDGVKGRDSGVIILHDGQLLGGGPYFWSAGSYTVGKNGTWKGELTTNQHTPFADPFVRPLFGGNEVSSGFTGTFTDDGADVFGTTLVGTKSMSFHATMKFLTAE